MYLQKMRMSGRLAVVTGGTSGIGLAICHALCEAGAKVIAVTNDMSQQSDAQRFIEQQGYHLDVLALDVSDSAQVQAVCDDIETTFGAVDCLVNNAGIVPTWQGAEELSDAVFLQVMDVNLNGVMWCCRSFGKNMLHRGCGTVVNVGSMSGIINNYPQKQCYYNISKAGVHHLTKCLAAEWADKGVRVNCVAPTYIETPLTKFGMQDNPQMAQKWIDMTPMKRVGQTDEIASVVLFLASDASSLMTGSVVVADAGYTLW